VSKRSVVAGNQVDRNSPQEIWASQVVERPYWLRFILIVAVLAAYLTSLGGAFVFDDYPNIVEVKNIDDVSSALWSMAQLRSRSTTRLTFALNAAVFGKSAFFFHCVNLLIHAVSVLVLFELVRGSIEWWNRTHPSSLNPNMTGFLAALFWGVHPLGTMAVTYIVQRHESLMAMFYLLTLLCLLRGHLAQRSWPWYLGSIVCCWLGMGAKEVMITVPLVALTFDRCILASSWKEVLTKRGWVIAMFLVPAAVLLVQTMSVFDTESDTHESVLGAHETASSWLYLWTQAGVLVHYLRLSIWPIYLTFDYDWPVANSEWEYLLPAIFIWSLLILSFWLLYKRPAIGFVAITFFFILAPTSTIVPIIDVAFEHRMYLPLACLCVLAAMGLVIGIEKWRTYQPRESAYQKLFLVGLTLAVLLGIRTAYRNVDYHSQLTLWETTVASRPMNLRANHNLAKRLRDAGQPAEAERVLLKSIEYCKRYGYETFPLHGDLAEIYVNEGYFEKAYQRFQIALEAARSAPAAQTKYRQLLRDRQLAETTTSYGGLLDLLGRPKEAATQFDRAIQLRPDVAQWYVMAGHGYRQAGELKTALRRWKKALELDPTNGDVARDYSLLLLEAGHFAEAERALVKSIQNLPDDLLLRFQLARLQAAAPVDEVRDLNSSLKLCGQLLKDYPQHAGELELIQATALGNAGQTEEAISILRSLQENTSAEDVKTQRSLETMIARFQQKQKVLLAK